MSALPYVLYVTVALGCWYFLWGYMVHDLRKIGPLEGEDWAVSGMASMMLSALWIATLPLLALGLSLIYVGKRLFQ